MTVRGRRAGGRALLRLLSSALAALLVVTALAACAAEGPADGAEAPAPRPVIYMGDTQSDPDGADGYAPWGALLAAARERAPDAQTLLLGGDVVNEEGDEDEWADFFAAGGEALSAFAVYTVPGNHTADAAKTAERFDQPVGDIPGYERNFYSFTEGDVRFLMLDSVLMGTLDEELRGAIAGWIGRTLEQSDARWHVAVLHHPMFSLNGAPRDEQRAETMRANYLPLLEQRVDVILCGHQHAYARTVPLRNGTPADGGLVQVMGVAGGKHYTLTETALLEKSVENTSVYTVLTASEAALTLETYDAAGTRIDAFTIRRATDGLPGAGMVRVSGDGLDGAFLCDLNALAADAENAFSGRYSGINNWPTEKFAAAAGVTLKAVLAAAGVQDDFELLTVVGIDGYTVRFTREQVLAARYYYPGLMDGDPSGNRHAPMILATAYHEGGETDAMGPVPPMLVFGQENLYEHNIPAFVENVAELIVSNEDPGQWEAPGVFPEAGRIASGERVKLQHASLGLVKIFYTTDGTEPTAKSAPYNPSTYQPELNVPISVAEDLTVRAFAAGYGRRDSEVSEFHFTVS